MNTFLNYLLEASIGLCLFLLVYHLVLRKETNFRLNRIFLLTALIASVTFPLFKFNAPDSPVPSLNFSVEPAAAEALTYAADDSALIESYSTFSTWDILAGLYTTGLIIFLIVFIIRLIVMLKALKQAPAYTYNNHRIVELKSQDSPFSFFNYIFIGSTPPLTEKEKQQIIAHESIHAKLYHSFDILLLHVLGIIFWFNPVIRIYKKIFVQLHEFEADARAAEKHDVDEYCSLLAKVALHSADFKLANHFSNSLTLKRIEMMRTLKQKIKRWKLSVVTAVIPLFFFAVACQDQMIDDAIDLANNSTMAIDYPKEVQDKLDKLQNDFPENKFVVIEPTEQNGLVMAEDLKKSLAHIDPSTIKSVEIVKNIQDVDGRIRSFVIINYDERMKAVIETAGRDGVFSVVEQAATPKGGIGQLKVFMANNLKYKQPEKQGSVFVSFIINSDGSLDDFAVMKGLSAELDQEALRVARLMENWNPAQQNGKPVRSRFILPIHFGPVQPNVSEELIEIKNTLEVEFQIAKLSGKTVITGKVFDTRGIPLPGATLVLAGTTKGTTTDSEGSFKFETPETSGKLIVSFIAHENKNISF